MTNDPSPSLARALSHAFDTFESIRGLARQYEDQSPDLFAAFASAAVAAANGRDAVLTAATSPAQTAVPARLTDPAPGTDPREVADAIAASAAALAASLKDAADLAQVPQDHQACYDAATAARQIHQLLAADDSHSR